MCIYHQVNSNEASINIKLGASNDYVLKILGEPSTKQDVKEIQGIRWSYNPFPISIELVDNKVYSIKILKP